MLKLASGGIYKADTDNHCDLSGHIKGSTLYSHYLQIGRAVCVYDPTAYIPVHMNMNIEPLSSAVTGAFIPVETVHGVAGLLSGSGCSQVVARCFGCLPSVTPVRQFWWMMDLAFVRKMLGSGGL